MSSSKGFGERCSLTAFLIRVVRLAADFPRMILEATFVNNFLSSLK